MKEFKLPYYWKDELKDLLLEEGFDRVINQIEEWIKENNFLLDDGTAKPL